MTLPPQTLALLSGSLALSLALGTRQGFGLFLQPLGVEQGISVADAALAVAIHNLVWGLAQTPAGAWADRVGTSLPVAVGALLYAAGLLLPGLFPGPLTLLVGVGVLTGVGTALLTWGTILAGVGRAFPDDRRSSALGIASAGGSVGQMLLLPLTAVAILWFGAAGAFVLLGILLLAALPAGIAVDRARLVPARPRGASSASGAVRRALAEPNFLLLTAGFFTCGFQLAFLSTHLPGYLALCGMAGAHGAAAWALMVVGGFNILGSFAAGRLGTSFPPQMILAVVYAVRGLAILLFWWADKTPLTLFLFAAIMGLLWLGTVPLTSAVIARRFGMGDVGALFGVAFISHQVGGFLGAFLGGHMLGVTGSYDAVFLATAAAGLLAAAFNAPIRTPAAVPVRA